MHLAVLYHFGWPASQTARQGGRSWQMAIYDGISQLAAMHCNKKGHCLPKSCVLITVLWFTCLVKNGWAAGRWHTPGREHEGTALWQLMAVKIDSKMITQFWVFESVPLQYWVMCCLPALQARQQFCSTLYCITIISHDLLDLCDCRDTPSHY